MTKREKRDRSFAQASIRNVAIFAVCYIAAFLIFRFDIPRYGNWFRHPMPSRTAGWIALVLAVVGFFYAKKISKD